MKTSNSGRTSISWKTKKEFLSKCCNSPIYLSAPPYCYKCKQYVEDPRITSKPTDQKPIWEEWESINENNNQPVGGSHWIIREEQVKKDRIKFIEEVEKAAYKRGKAEK